MDQVRSILVVDGDQDAIKAMASCLSEHELEVASTSLWTEAIARIQEKPPDLVLLDLNLPTVQGDVLLAFIREIDKALPVVLSASGVDAGRMARLDELGANGFIRKPFDPDDLVVVVERVLAESARQEPEEDAAGGDRRAERGQSRGSLQEDPARAPVHVSPGAGVETLRQRQLNAAPSSGRVRKRHSRKRRGRRGKRVLSYILAFALVLTISAVIWGMREFLLGGSFFGISLNLPGAEEPAR